MLNVKIKYLKDLKYLNSNPIVLYTNGCRLLISDNPKGFVVSK